MNSNISCPNCSNPCGESDRFCATCGIKLMSPESETGTQKTDADTGSLPTPQSDQTAPMQQPSPQMQSGYMQQPYSQPYSQPYQQPYPQSYPQPQPAPMTQPYSLPYSQLYSPPAPMPFPCTKCGRVLEPDVLFCDTCGTKQYQHQSNKTRTGDLLVVLENCTLIKMQLFKNHGKLLLYDDHVEYQCESPGNSAAFAYYEITNITKHSSFSNNQCMKIILSSGRTLIYDLSETDPDFFPYVINMISDYRYL